MTDFCLKLCAAACAAGILAESSTAFADPPSVRVGARFGILFGDSGAGSHAGLFAGMTIHPRVSIGGTIHSLVGASNNDGDCWYGGRCTTTFTQGGPYVEGRLFSDGIVDPWARLSIGVGTRGAPKAEPFGTGVFAASFGVDAGVAFRVWRMSIGPYLTGILLTRNEATKGVGIQVGIEL